MHAWSRDGGETWTAPHPIAGLYGGPSGPPHMAIDAAHTLHLLTVVNGQAGGEEIAHVSWDGAAWSAPERLLDDSENARSRRDPAIAIADGNHLYTAFQVNERAIFVTDLQLDAPALARRPVPTMVSGWRGRIVQSSPQLRIVVAVLVFLALEATVEYGWRRRRSAAR
jgi:hypothetical protein